MGKWNGAALQTWLVRHTLTNIATYACAAVIACNNGVADGVLKAFSSEGARTSSCNKTEHKPLIEREVYRGLRELRTSLN